MKPRLPLRLVLIGALALAVSACADDTADPTEPADSAVTTTAPEGVTTTPGDTTTAPPAETAPGLDDCVANPDTCNSGVAAEGGEVTVLISLPFEGWSQLRAATNSVYVVQVVEGIFPNNGSRFNPSGEWVWDEYFYAEEPRITSDNPQTIEFTISDDAVWSDGTPITYRDLKYQWFNSSGNESLCAGCEPPSTADWGLVESVEGSDDGKRVTITLREGARNPEWAPAYAEDYYPTHLAEAEGFDWENDPVAMNESAVWFSTTMPTWSGGAWMIESGTLGETVVKVPNPAYYGPAPHLDRIVGEVVADPATWIQALSNRDLDAGSPATFDVDVWNELPTIPGLLSSSGSAGAAWEHIDLNTANEFLADPELRRAIFTAIDAEDLASRIWGAAQGMEVTPRLNHTFSQLSPYFEDHRTATGFGSGDVSAAHAILEAAGYTGYDSGSLTTPDGREVSLNFRWPAGNTNRARTGELVQSYLADLGLAVDLLDHESLGGMLAAGDYDMVIFGWSGPPRFVSFLTQGWHSDSDSNFNSINNPEIDQLGTEAALQTDLGVSAVLANELSQILMDEAVVLPLWDSPNMDFVFDDIVNLRPNHNNSARIWYNQSNWGYVVE